MSNVWIEYEKGKQEIVSLNLPSNEYEIEIQKLIDKLGI